MTSRDDMSHLPRAMPLSGLSIVSLFSKINHGLASSVGVPPSDWPVFCYIHDAQLFLQPQPTPHKTQFSSNGNCRLLSDVHCKAGKICVCVCGVCVWCVCVCVCVCGVCVCTAVGRPEVSWRRGNSAVTDRPTVSMLMLVCGPEYFLRI